jgi:hypothetical protein
MRFRAEFPKAVLKNANKDTSDPLRTDQVKRLIRRNAVVRIRTQPT